MFRKIISFIRHNGKLLPFQILNFINFCLLRLCIDERIQICAWSFMSQLFSNVSVSQNLLFQTCEFEDNDDYCLFDLALSRWTPEDRCFNEISNLMIQSCVSVDCLFDRWSEISDRMHPFALNGDSGSSVHRMRYLKFLERLTKEIKTRTGSLENNYQISAPINLLNEWWLSLIKVYLDPCLRDVNDGNIRCIACDILSNLPDCIFKSFPVCNANSIMR